MVPCVREIVHESRILASIIDPCAILAREGAFVLIDAHVIVAIFESRGYWDPAETIVEMFTESSGLFF